MNSLDSEREKLNTLLVVPPFASLDKPSLGAHILKACAKDAGFSVNILYANLIFASFIGEEIYQSISYNSSPTFIGERIFKKAAYENFKFQDNTQNYKFS